MNLSASLPALFVVALQGILLSAVILFLKRQNRNTAVAFGVFLFLCSLTLLDHLLRSTGFSLKHPEFYYLSVPFCYLIGPSNYFYVKTYLDLDKSKAFWQKFFIPHGLGFFLILPAYLFYLLLAESEKSVVISQGFLLVAGDMRLSDILQNFQTTIYLFASMNLFAKNWRRFDKFPIALGFILVSSTMIQSFIFFDLFSLYSGMSSFVSFAISALIFLICLLLCWKTDFFILPFRIAKQKYWKSGLSKDNLDKLSQRLLLHMEKSKCFLDPNLNLQKLASQLNIPRRHLSELLSLEFQQSFYEMIAMYRVTQAKEILKKAPYKKTMLDLAFEVGFNSKSSFYNSFKKQTGQTPLEFSKKKHTNTGQKRTRD